MEKKIISSINNVTVLKSLLKTENIVNGYKNIAVSISGGSDSDLLIDIMSKIETESNVKYIFFNTGLEYKATLDHLDYLEDRYGIEIERLKVKKPIPSTVKLKGQPFKSKQVSEMIKRLQKHNFKWEDKPFEELIKEYPKCRCALRWWCNDKSPSLNINYNRFLKEFMIKYPPDFPISNDCCLGAKKDPSKQFIKENNIDLMIVGIRKAEGGVRNSHKSCFKEKDSGADEFYPILWYKKEDKNYYEDLFNVVHSEAYSVYGLKRTGCAGCPFGRDFEFELKVIDEHEQKLYKAATYIFKDSYEYTRKYIEFVKCMKLKLKDQIHIGEILK